jgi:hypothetical protein
LPGHGLGERVYPVLPGSGSLRYNLGLVFNQRLQRELMNYDKWFTPVETKQIWNLIGMAALAVMVIISFFNNLNK